MTVKYKVLQELLKEERISGASLAETIGVSRTAIWKSINSLRKDGYIIEAKTNLGYILVNTGDTLTKQSVQKYLNIQNLDLHVYETIASTNTSLKEWGSKGYKEGTVIISKEQTSGKGRLGRKFSSPNGTGIYMSVLLRPNFSAEKALSITTAAAVAVAKSIEKLSDKKAKIKWVNDIFVDNKKVCGILTEAAINFETSGLDYAVVGIGINLFTPENGFDEEIKNIAGAVFDNKINSDIRSQFTACILDEFMAIYNKLPDNSYISEYKSRSYLDGKEVTLNIGQIQKSGIVVGIDNNARLLVKLENGEVEAFSAGEALINKK
ncbi:MAG: biotin--[acetyl-CoA-carboxylase] ligase [Clostridia bacterium]